MRSWLILFALYSATSALRAFPVWETSDSGLENFVPALTEPASRAHDPVPTAQRRPMAEQKLFEPTDSVVVATLAHLRSRHTGLSAAELPALAELIVAESRRHGLDPALALAVIRVESGCFNYAVSEVGALGLMQIMPATGRELATRLGIPWHGTDSLFDPRVNVRVGITYLKQLSDRYGSTHTALAAYNWGPGRIDRRIRRGQGVPKLYARRVLRTLREAGIRLQTS